MAVFKPDKEILERYRQYQDYMDCSKMVGSPYRISETKKNHDSSFFASYPIMSIIKFGEVSFYTELRNGDHKDFSISCISDAINKHILCRYDSGEGVHRNNVPSIPLKDQLVSTPHIHYYNEEGYFIAFKPKEFLDPEINERMLDIENGFPYFCKHTNITSITDDSIPLLEICPNGVLDLNISNTDPNDGVKFKDDEPNS